MNKAELTQNPRGIRTQFKPAPEKAHELRTHARTRPIWAGVQRTRDICKILFGLKGTNRVSITRKPEAGYNLTINVL